MLTRCKSHRYKHQKVFHFITRCIHVKTIILLIRGGVGSKGWRIWLRKLFLLDLGMKGSLQWRYDHPKSAKQTEWQSRRLSSSWCSVEPPLILPCNSICQLQLTSYSFWLLQVSTKNKTQICSLFNNIWQLLYKHFFMQTLDLN